MKIEIKELDPLAWAKRIRSQTAMDFLMKGCSEGDSRLQEIFAGVVSDGVCTKQGKLLRRWDGIGWVQVSAAAEVEAWA